MEIPKFGLTLLLKILFLCFSNSSNFLLMGVQNWNSPTLAEVKLSPFILPIMATSSCSPNQPMSEMSWNRYWFPVKSPHPNLGDTLIEVGMKRVCLDMPPPSNQSQADKKSEHEQDFWDELMHPLDDPFLWGYSYRDISMLWLSTCSQEGIIYF